MSIKFVDLKRSLVDEVRKLGIVNAVWSDYFAEAYRTTKPVLMTASNPAFTLGGGIDALFKSYFPEPCAKKQNQGGGNERIGNICFVITVGSDLRATKELVREAIKFGIENTKEDETLLLNGAGTGIGGLSQKEFVEVVKELFEKSEGNNGVRPLI